MTPDKITIEDHFTFSVRRPEGGPPQLLISSPVNEMGLSASLDELMALNILISRLAGERAKWDALQHPGAMVGQVEFSASKAMIKAYWDGLQAVGVGYLPGTRAWAFYEQGRLDKEERRSPRYLKPSEELPERVADARTIGIQWPSPDATWPNAKRAGWNAYFDPIKYPFPPARTDLQQLWDAGHAAAQEEFPMWPTTAPGPAVPIPKELPGRRRRARGKPTADPGRRVLPVPPTGFDNAKTEGWFSYFEGHGPSASPFPTDRIDLHKAFTEGHKYAADIFPKWHK